MELAKIEPIVIVLPILIAFIVVAMVKAIKERKNNKH